METDRFCREIEAHLCRRNGGHLVRLVGPAFEMVMEWARQDIPLKVACRGIDRFFERDLAKDRTRRRPVRIEFCEADVLDSFDQWRRAVGVGTAGTGVVTPGGGGEAAGAGEEGGDDGPSARRTARPLRQHLDRAVTRLTDALAAGRLPAGLDVEVGRMLDALAGDREAARTVRGTARQDLIARLQQVDEALMARARAAIGAAALESLRAEAETDLAGFRGRMTEEDYQRAVDAATTALVRERLRLPVIGYPL